MTVTHPFHPLRGQQLEIVCIRRGTDPDIIARCSDDSHVAIAMSWTDYAAPSCLEPLSTSPHLLAFDGLYQAAQLIDHIRQEGRYPTTDGAASCAPSSDDYD